MTGTEYIEVGSDLSARLGIFYDIHVGEEGAEIIARKIVIRPFAKAETVRSHVY